MINSIIEFRKENRNEYILVEFELTRPIRPDELPLIEKRFENLFSIRDFFQGLIISGRGPIWLFASLVHTGHPFRWVACMDPRFNGGVVVMSHDPAIEIGSIIHVEEE